MENQQSTKNGRLSDRRNSDYAEAQISGDFSAEPVSQASNFPRYRAETWRQRLVILVLVFSDILLALLVWQLAFVLQSLWGNGPLSGFTVAGVVPSVAVWVGLRVLLGLYPGYGLDQVEELRRQTYAVLVTLAITATFAVALQAGDLVSRLVLAVGFLSLLLLAPLVRQIVKRWMRKAGLWGKPVIIFSSGEPGGRVAALLNREWGLGYNPVAIFGDQASPERRFEEKLGEKSLADAILLAKRHGIDSIIFAMPYTRREQLARLVDLASVSFQHVTVIPNLSGITNSAVKARDFAGTFGVEIRQNLLNPWSKRIKRTLDLLGSGLGGVVLLPLLFAVAVLIKLESPGPALFVQRRPGRNREKLRILKFRTMYQDAEQRLDELFLNYPLLGEEFERHGKLKDDPRVTRVGYWLRRYSLDELPQLWNVLKGEMSLIGPRPYLISQTLQISGSENFILRASPGISGLWQVSGRSDTTLEERVQLDVYYVQNWSVWLDIVILARTVRAVLFRRGAY